MSLNEIPPLFRRSMKDESNSKDVTLSSERLKLFRGSEDKGKYVSSPFVTKVEFRLRLSDVKYDIEAGAPWLGPKGKIPYLEVQGETAGEKQMLGDSALIIQHFVKEGSLSDLNTGLTPSEKAQDLALRSLLEDKLYFYHVSSLSPMYLVRRSNAMCRCENAGLTTTTSNETKLSGRFRYPSESSSVDRFTAK